MADIFQKRNAAKLLRGKKLVFFGDSNIRHLYKDLIWLLSKNSIIPNDILRRKGENSHEGDRLVGTFKLVASRDYKENRKYLVDGFNIEYIFITRCLNQTIEEYLNGVKTNKLPAPDVIVMNSTLWDLTRWGSEGVKQFRKNLVDLMKLLNESLPESTMFIWTTALPPGKNIRKGSLLIKQVEFLEHTVRFDVMEANSYAKNVVVAHGYDVLDLHFHLRMQIHRRSNDGLHYQSLPTRLLTNILLTHIALSWGHPLPHNVNNSLLDRYKEMVSNNEKETQNKETKNVNIPKKKNNTPNKVSKKRRRNKKKQHFKKPKNQPPQLQRNNLMNLMNLDLSQGLQNMIQPFQDNFFSLCPPQQDRFPPFQMNNPFNNLMLQINEPTFFDNNSYNNYNNYVQFESRNFLQNRYCQNRYPWY